jgi:glucokinase
VTEPIIIGVDVGGTHLRAAQFNGRSHVPASKVKQPTQPAPDHAAIMQHIEGIIRAAAPANLAGVVGVGLAAPGPLDPFAGVVIDAPNLPGWVNLPLKQEMQARLGVPVFLGNDANLAGLAEWKFGAARGHADVLYLTISTGIGGGVIAGGQLLLGARGLAAEVGHITVVPDGPVCGCGQRGHLEAVASGTAIGRDAQARLKQGEGADSAVQKLVNGDLEQVTGAVVGAAAQAGDAFARARIAAAGALLGRGVASLLHVYNPSIVVFGGGVSQLGELLLEPVRAAVQQFAMSEVYWRDCPLVTAHFGDDSGLVGAAALAMQELGW